MVDVTERPIEGFPGYSVTEDGVIYANLNWRGYGKRVLIQQLNDHGYPSVRLKTGTGTRKRKLVHSLVAAAFLPPRPSARHEIRHLDGDQTNNRASSLAWGTAKDNCDDRDRHGRTAKGAKHGVSALTDDEVREIKESLAEGETHASIGLRFGVHKDTIGSIARGRTWRHVT